MAAADVATPPTNGAPVEALSKLDLVSNGNAELSKETISALKLAPHHPTSSSQAKPPATLTAEQESKYKSLLSTARSWTDIPDTLKGETPASPITDTERQWLTRECLLRYLRASKWVLPTAQKRVLATLSWRREWGVTSHTADYISEENATGKQVIMGYDVEGRPCLYMHPQHQNTKESKRQMQHLVYMIERTIDIMPPGQETVVWLINYKNLRSGQGGSVDQGRQTIYIMQNHYPERLGKAFIQNLPWTVKMFWKLMMPFIDPVTKTKLHFDDELRNFIPPEQLMKDYGGDVDFEYEHEVYWPDLNKLADERRREMTERWVKAGKKIGESEAYLKGLGEPVGDEEEKKVVESAGVVEETKNAVVKPVEHVEAEVKAPEPAALASAANVGTADHTVV